MLPGSNYLHLGLLGNVSEFRCASFLTYLLRNNRLDLSGVNKLRFDAALDPDVGQQDHIIDCAGALSSGMERAANSARQGLAISRAGRTSTLPADLNWKLRSQWRLTSGSLASGLRHRIHHGLHRIPL